MGESPGSANEMWNSRPRLFFGGLGFPAFALAGEGACSTFFGVYRRKAQRLLPLPISRVLSGEVREGPGPPGAGEAGRGPEAPKKRVRPGNSGSAGGEA